MSASIADIMSVSITKVINTKVNAYIHDFTERLCSKYNLEESDVLALWSEVMPDLKIKEKKIPSKTKTKTVDPSQVGCCKHIPDAGKFKGIECGKRCIGEWCPSHTPEKLEKAKAKRALKKTQKQSSDDSDDGKSSEKLLKNFSNLEQLLKNLKVVDWDTDDSSISIYPVLKCSMNKVDLEHLIGKSVEPVEEFDEDGGIYPFTFYIKGKSLYVSYVEGEDEECVDVKLKTPLNPQLTRLVTLMKAL